jgi:hypothetical protein
MSFFKDVINSIMAQGKYEYSKNTHNGLDDLMELYGSKKKFLPFLVFLEEGKTTMRLEN